MDIETIIEKQKTKEELLCDIPTIKKIIQSLGTRIKRQGDLLFILEHAIKDLQSYSTEEGQKKLKQETYNYVISTLREEMGLHKDKKIEYMSDLMKMLPIKCFKNSGRKQATEE